VGVHSLQVCPVTVDPDAQLRLLVSESRHSHQRVPAEDKMDKLHMTILDSSIGTVNNSLKDISYLWVNQEPHVIVSSPGTSRHKSDSVGRRSAPPARLLTHWLDRYKVACSNYASILPRFRHRLCPVLANLCTVLP
jgi:hypothetical protein